MGRDHAGKVGEGDLADQADPLDAGVVDQNVDPPRLAIDVAERRGSRFRGLVTSVSRSGHALATVLGADLVQREDPRAVLEPDEQRCPSPMPRAPPVTTATFPERDAIGAPVPAQYISQPPLTLIVAPVM